MKTALIIIVAILAINAVIFICFVFYKSRQARRRVYQELGNDSHILPVSKASFAGFSSLSHHQTNGPGHLGLTADKLVFCMLLPTFKIVLKTSRITKVLIKTNDGKRIDGKSMLEFFFDSGDEKDSAVFAVHNASAWESAIAELIQRR